MVEDKPRYLLKIKGCYYWRPTKRMRTFGFKLQCLGKNDVPAKQAAIAWNDKWDRVRRGDAVNLDDATVIYPEGTIGEAYQRVMNLRKAARENKGAIWTTTIDAAPNSAACFIIRTSRLWLTTASARD